jgi:hypothetical protein
MMLELVPHNCIVGYLISDLLKALHCCRCRHNILCK